MLSRVLDLADARMTASDLLDLCALPPVARRFAFSEDDLERLGRLVAGSGVRWGLDAEHRRPYGMAAFGQNTWAAGLDRLLLGVTMDEEGEHFIGTALPLDDVDSSDVDLVGRLAELVDRVRRLRRRFRRTAAAGELDPAAQGDDRRAGRRPAEGVLAGQPTRYAELAGWPRPARRPAGTTEAVASPRCGPCCRRRSAAAPAGPTSAPAP